MQKSKRIVNKELIKEMKESHSCIICNNPEVDIHHIKARAAQGPDKDWNLVPLCRVCHGCIHTIGTNAFAEKYMQFTAFLIFFGWYKNELGKWMHE